MNGIPEFWRAEIWHPLSVHFPIALLTFATLFFIISLFLKGSKANSFTFMAKVLLLIGVVAAWVSIYTGNKADGAVSRTICDPIVLKDHEISAYTSTIIFSIAAFFLLLTDIPFVKKGVRLLQVLVLAGLLAGSGYLIYAGHLGATVVYQQGAGVYKPDPNCTGFGD